MAPTGKTDNHRDDAGAGPDRSKAVALRYRPDRDSAPRVTAKGSGHVAQRMLELARKQDIPIREDRNLIQVLSHLDPDQEIPPELYFVVAEILAFVYWSARTCRQELSESYRRLGDRRFAEGDREGARRSWQTAEAMLKGKHSGHEESTEG